VRAARGRRCPSLVLAATGAELGDDALEALERRPEPDAVDELLAWAPYPLATVEVAAICRRPTATVRDELRAAGARFAPAGGDGYWSAR
jgi:hypothetical protein